MKFTVVILPEARDDIRLAAKWYNKQKKGLGKEFISSVKESIKVLKVNPFFVKRYKEIHTLLLKQFPFMIHFVIDESSKTVTILAVLHTSLNPTLNWL